MAEKGFTVYLDNSANEGGKSDRKPGGNLASSSKEANSTPMTASVSEGSSASTFSPSSGPTQGPFISKSSHPEFEGVRMTDDGIKTIIRQEGYQAASYPDAAGYSVGYGHFLGEGEKGKGVSITPEEGLKYLADDIKKFEKQIASRIKVPLDDDQFTALVSFAYNAGAGSLDKGISAKINAGNMQGAADQMKKYVKSRDAKTKELVLNDHLVKRREFETGLLLGKKQ